MPITERLALPTRLRKDSRGLAIPPDSLVLKTPVPSLPEEFYTQKTNEQMNEILNVDDVKSSLNDLLLATGEMTAGFHVQQLGYGINMFMVDWTSPIAPSAKPEGYKPQHRVFIGGRIIRHSEAKNMFYEGCFSVKSKVIGDVERYDQVTLEGWEVDLEHFKTTDPPNKLGEIRVKKIVEDTPFDNPSVARIVQHELDHPEGRRFPARAIPGSLREITGPFSYKTPYEGITPLPTEEAEELISQAQPV